jgi:hypothetical protein
VRPSRTKTAPPSARQTNRQIRRSARQSTRAVRRSSRSG